MNPFITSSTSHRSATTAAIRIRLHLMIAALLVVTTGCVLAPYELEHFGPNSTIPVQGVARSASIQITVEAFNKATGVWDDIASTTSAATPTVSAGTWNGSPDLFFYSFSVQIPNPCYWDASCSFPAGDFTAKIRVREGPRDNAFYELRGAFDSLSCAQGRLGNGEDFVSAGYNCGYNDTVITLFHIG
jgi:hypothetical protein